MLSDDPFARIPKNLLNDDSISWKAKGVLCYMLGKPNDWKVWVSDLVKRGTDGHSAIRSALKELRQIGYARLERVLVHGKIQEWRFIVFDTKQPVPSVEGKELGCALSVNPDGTPYTENQHVENQDVGNQQHTKKDHTEKEIKKNGMEELAFRVENSESESKPKLEEVKDAWNSIEGLPKVRMLSKGRLRHLKARLAEKEWSEGWREALDMIPKSSFLMGESGGERKWQADFDWFIKTDSVAKILEGKYSDRKPTYEPPPVNFSVASKPKPEPTLEEELERRRQFEEVRRKCGFKPGNPLLAPLPVRA